MSFSGFIDEDQKKKKKTGSGSKSCKCCKWGSPKFYQLIMNDIPLICCQPCAYFFGLLDMTNFAVGVTLTAFDLISILLYLYYDEELSIDSEAIY